MSSPVTPFNLQPEDSKILRWFLITITTLAILYLLGLVFNFLGQFSDVIIILFVAWLLSFILDPPVRYLTIIHIPKVVSALIVYLLVAGILILAGVVFIPVLTDQTKSFVNALNVTQDSTPHWVVSLQLTLQNFGIYTDLGYFIRQQIETIRSISAVTLSQTLSLATSVLTFLFYSLLALIFSFYLVIDGDRIWKVFLEHLPTRWHKDLRFVKDAAAYTFAGFLRTQVLLGLMMGLVIYIVLWVFGVQYSVTAATFSGIAMIVPVLGPILSIIPPLIVALVSQPDKALLIFLIIFLLQAVIVNVIGPLLFNRTIGLHPVLVLLSFMVGFKMFGGWGAVFAVPVAGVLIMVGSQLLRYWTGPHHTELGPE